MCFDGLSPKRRGWWRRSRISCFWLSHWCLSYSRLVIILTDIQLEISTWPLRRLAKTILLKKSRRLTTNTGAKSIASGHARSVEICPQKESGISQQCNYFLGYVVLIFIHPLSHRHKNESPILNEDFFQKFSALDVWKYDAAPFYYAR